MSFEIDLKIDDIGLQNIASTGQSVTVVQSVISSADGPPAPLPVAWLAFMPLEQNTIKWDQSYFIYATTTLSQAGAQINLISQTQSPVQPGILNTLENGFFSSAPGGIPPTSFDASNQESGFPILGFGLAQQATMNNGVALPLSPLNMVPVLFNEQVSFIAEVTLSIFLSTAQNNGTVLSSIASGALQFTLTSANPTISLGFDDTTNTFFVSEQVTSGGQKPAAVPSVPAKR